MTCIRRNMSPRNAIQPSKTTGLVIGAGGMARAAVYAMIQLGCRKVFICNRTVENAEAVARHFNSWASGLSSDGEIVRVLRSTSEDWPVGYRQPTMIVSCVPARSVGDHAPANFEMPMQWLGSPTGGVVVEVSSSDPLPHPRSWRYLGFPLYKQALLTSFTASILTPGYTPVETDPTCTGGDEAGMGNCGWLGSLARTSHSSI